MRVTIDGKLYCKPINVNLPIKFREKLTNGFKKVWPWGLVFVMFFGLAVLALRCF